MLALFWLIPFTLVLGRAGWVLFASTVRSGQYDDLDAAAHRILSDDDPASRARRERPPQGEA
jgi:cbb3-type cytochrome oxidase maturation protein